METVKERLDPGRGSMVWLLEEVKEAGTGSAAAAIVLYSLLPHNGWDW